MSRTFSFCEKILRTRNRSGHFLARIGLLAGLFVVGMSSMLPACVSSGELVASDGSRRLIAHDTPSGLTMVVTTGAWSGDPAIDSDFAVIHVLIDNRGSEPVLIAPGEFELRDSRGFLYRLQDAGGSFKRVERSDGRYIGTNEYDPGGDFPFERVATDDPDFARSALPWGILEPGAQIRGYVYFEPVTQTANQASLFWHSQTPQHLALATLGFELHVARGAQLQNPES